MRIFNLKKGQSEVLASYINKNNINDIIQDFNVAFKQIEDYFRGDTKEFRIYWDYEKSESFKNYLSPIYAFFQDNYDFLNNYFDNFQEYKIYSFVDSYKNWEETISQINENYVKQEIERSKDFFDCLTRQFDLELNDDQKVAVVTDEDSTQIIASAGTGKTTTLISKVKYLIECKDVEPHKILCLSYNRNSTDHLKDKFNQIGILNEEYGFVEGHIRVSTLHNFGKSFLDSNGIIKSGKGSSDSGIDFFNITSTEILKEYFKKEIKKDMQFLYDLQLHYYNLLNGYIEDSEEYERIQYYDEKNPLKVFKTLDGKCVYSLTDLKIANFLITKGISFSYDSTYYNGLYDGKQLRASFYLPSNSNGVFIENFAIDTSGNVPWLNDNEKSEEYIKQMNFIKECCEENNENLIILNSLDSDFLSDLENELLYYGVKFQPLKDFELKKKIEEVFLSRFEYRYNPYKDKLFKRIISFIDLFKLQDYKKEHFTELKELYDDNEIFFISLIEKFYNYYEHYLKTHNLIDFTDMINKGIDSLYGTNFDYILVDEFQDISKKQLELIKKAKEDSKAKLVVVGDDWQSINGYQGSDYRYLVNFDKIFPHAERCFLHETFRCQNSLIHAASYFVGQDENLIPIEEKKLYSKKDEISKPIQIIYKTSHEDETEIAYNILKEIASDSENKEAMMVSRYRFPGGYGYKINEFKKYLENNEIRSDFNIDVFTMHAAKGLESQNVIISNVNTHYRYGFPSNKQNDEIERHISLNDKKYQYNEERRLFYMALTRSKNKVYIITVKNEQSPFIEELDPKYIEKFSYVSDNSENGSHFIPLSSEDSKSSLSGEDIKNDSTRMNQDPILIDVKNNKEDISSGEVKEISNKNGEKSNIQEGDLFNAKKETGIQKSSQKDKSQQEKDKNKTNFDENYIENLMKSPKLCPHCGKNFNKTHKTFVKYNKCPLCGQILADKDKSDTNTTKSTKEMKPEHLNKLEPKVVIDEKTKKRIYLEYIKLTNDNTSHPNNALEKLSSKYGIEICVLEDWRSKERWDSKAKNLKKLEKIKKNVYKDLYRLIISHKTKNEAFKILSRKYKGLTVEKLQEWYDKYNWEKKIKKEHDKNKAKMAPEIKDIFNTFRKFRVEKNYTLEKTMKKISRYHTVLEDTLYRWYEEYNWEDKIKNEK